MVEPPSLFTLLLASPLQSGTVGSALLLLSGGVGKLVADLTINRQKAEFSRQLEMTKADLDQERDRTKGQLNADLERIRAELSREADTHKSRLKKADLLFEKEIDAAREFLSLHQKIQPKWTNPDDGWREATQEITDRLGEIERDLRSFLAAFGYAITPAARDALQKCIQTAEGHKFDAMDNYQDDYLERFLQELSLVENHLLGALRL